MMKYILALSAITLSFLSISCNSNEPEEKIVTQTKERIVKDAIIYKGESSYAKYFSSNVSGEVGYRSSREHPLQTRDFSANSINTGTFSKAGANKGLSVLINKQSIDEMNGATKAVKSVNNNNLSQGFYGREVTFSFPTGSMVKTGTSSTSNGSDITMYVPEVVEILYPKSHKSLHPICFFDMYKLKWNADANNKNGIAIVVEWDGDILTAESENKSFRRIDIVEDTGETMIKKEMFDDMPHLAIVKVTIIRGCVDIAEINDMTYKVYAESDATLYTIIARKSLK